jgi:hypothetical protein
MRRAAPAEKIEFSLGGLPDAAVGLRRRCARAEAPLVEERRLMAELILRASELDHFSSSELVLPLFSAEDLLGEAFSTMFKDDLRMALLPISRSGDVFSESELKVLMTRGAGEPSDFFERAPSAKRPERLRSTDGFGGDGIGEEPS